jgi:K+-sensing histidine kinase KdpD
MEAFHATSDDRRYVTEPTSEPQGFGRRVERLRHALTGPRRKPGLVARLAVAVLSVALAGALTNVHWRITGDLLIEFYLLACVIATWYGGLSTGLVTVLIVSVLEFDGPLESAAGWQVTEASAWIRLAFLTGAALTFAFMWEALKRRERELEDAIDDLQVVIDLVPAPIAMAEEPDCNYIRINAAMAHAFGVPRGVIASATGPPHEQPHNFSLRRDGIEIPGDQLPVQRAAATRQRTPREQIEVVRDDGVTLQLVGEAVPLFDAVGRVRGAVGAFTDITESLAVEAELRAANHVKDEFLGLVSHELKTPITVIRGNAEVLDTRGSQIDDVSRAIAVRDIRRESERLSRMVDDLLSLSRLGLLQLEKEPLLVRRVVDRIVAEHRRYDQGRPMPVRGDAPPALGAAVAVEHILHNLLTNAERYSPQYTPIGSICAMSGKRSR